MVVISDYASLNKDSSTLIEESKVNVKAISFQTEDDGEQMVFIPDLEKPPSVYISLLDYCATTYNEFIDKLNNKSEISCSKNNSEVKILPLRDKFMLNKTETGPRWSCIREDLPECNQEKYAILLAVKGDAYEISFENFPEGYSEDSNMSYVYLVVFGEITYEQCRGISCLE